MDVNLEVVELSYLRHFPLLPSLHGHIFQLPNKFRLLRQIQIQHVQMKGTKNKIIISQNAFTIYIYGLHHYKWKLLPFFFFLRHYATSGELLTIGHDLLY
jgi:hypothetical protein